MRRINHSLALKVGAIILVVEFFVLAVMGIFYVNRFSDEVDRRIETQIQLPGVLMNAGLLSYDSVVDATTMQQLVGEELIIGMVVGVNGNVFYALDPASLGAKIDDFASIDADWFDTDNPHSTIVYQGKTVTSVTPIFASDGSTPRFFVYIQVGSSEAIAENMSHPEF